jgi:hypothetical protein
MEKDGIEERGDGAEMTGTTPQIQTVPPDLGGPHRAVSASSRRAGRSANARTRRK